MSLRKKDLKQVKFLFGLSFFLAITGCGLFNSGQVEVCNVKEKAEQYRSEGYEAKGAKSMEAYLLEACQMDTATNEDGEDKYMMAFSEGTGQDFQNARNAVKSDITSTIAGRIETRVAGLTKRSLNNEIISQRSAESINKTVTANKLLIAQDISRDIIYTFSREIEDEEDGKTIVQVEALAYFSKRMADKIAKEKLKEKMEDETEELHEDLNKLFDLPNDSQIQ